MLQNGIHDLARQHYHQADSRINIIGVAVCKNFAITRRQKIFPLLFPPIFKFLSLLLTKMQEIRNHYFATCGFPVRCLAHYLLESLIKLLYFCSWDLHNPHFSYCFLIASIPCYWRLDGSSNQESSSDHRLLNPQESFPFFGNQEYHALPFEAIPS